MNGRQNLRLKRAAFPLLLTLAIGGLLLFLAAGQRQAAHALDCTVGSGKQFSTIQSAINDANCDTIIVDAGTYNENLNISRSLTLQSAGGSKPVVDGGGNGRVVTINGSITVYLTNLRLTNGDATSASPSLRNGGGLLVTGGATLHAANLQIDNNIASTAAQTGFGGGVAINPGSAYITDTLVTNNHASRREGTFTGGGQGGGLYVNGDSYLSLYSSDVTNNVAAYRAGDGTTSFAAGGGLFQNGDSTVETAQNTWHNNVARGENSVECNTCTLTSGSGDGGAIAVQVTTTTAQLYVNGDSFTDNVANASNADYGSNEKAGGGGVSLMATNTAGQITGTIRSAYFSGNVAKAGSGATPGNAEGRGGAIHVRLASLSVYQSTLLNNVAAVSGTGSGGGIYIREPGVGDSLTVINSILADNNASGLGQGAQVYVNYTNDSSNAATFAHVTIADSGSSPNPHHGIYYNAPTAGDDLKILNTIIANHSVGLQNINATGWNRARYLLFYNNTVDHPSPGAVAFPPGDVATWLNDDPLFVDPTGGDYHIQPGSPAIDAGGNPQTELINQPINTDVDGDARPNALSNGFDIGADELDLETLYLPMIIRN